MIITAGNDIWIKVTFHDDAIIAKVISSDSSGVEIQVSNAALLAKGGLHLNATGKTFSPPVINDPVIFVPFTQVMWIAQSRK